MADETTAPEDIGYTNEDLKNESIRDILTEEPKETPASEPETTETVIETPEVPAPPTAEEIAEKVAEKIHTKEEATEEVTTPAEDAYADWEKNLWEKEKRSPTYREALDFMKDEAIKAIKVEQEAERKLADEKVEQERLAQEENNKTLNAMVDDELGDLYNAGKLTKIIDANNPSDQGVVERKALFVKWTEVNDQRRQQGLLPITSATRIYEFYFEKPNAQPAGADAPIAGPSGTSLTPTETQEYSYADVKKPWSFYKRRQ